MQLKLSKWIQMTQKLVFYDRPLAAAERPVFSPFFPLFLFFPSLLLQGGTQELIYLTVFVIFSLRIYSSLSRNINGVSHMIDLCCLIQILHCSLCMYPTTHEPSTGVTARSNYVIISIYLPHDPGRKMKRNHETLKQLIANN